MIDINDRQQHRAAAGESNLFQADGRLATGDDWQLWGLETGGWLIINHLQKLTKAYEPL